MRRAEVRKSPCGRLISAIAKRIRGRRPSRRAPLRASPSRPSTGSPTRCAQAARKGTSSSYRNGRVGMHHAAGSRGADRAHRSGSRRRSQASGSSKIAGHGRVRQRPAAALIAGRLSCANIDIYSDASIPSERKSLILGFSGAAGQLMIPTPAFLQYVASERYDVVVLRDRTKQGYAHRHPALCRIICGISSKQLTAEHRAPPPIGASIPYGTSMGGFPALRCGLLLQDGNRRLRRRPVPVVSAASRPRTSISRAFDPLCDCNATIQDEADLLSQHRLPRRRPERRDARSACCRSSGCRSKRPGHAFLGQLCERGTAAGVLRPDVRLQLRRKRRLSKAAGPIRSLRPLSRVTASPFAREIVLGEPALQHFDPAVSLLDARARDAARRRTASAITAWIFGPSSGSRPKTLENTNRSVPALTALITRSSNE